MNFRVPSTLTIGPAAATLLIITTLFGFLAMLSLSSYAKKEIGKVNHQFANDLLVSDSFNQVSLYHILSHRYPHVTLPQTLTAEVRPHPSSAMIAEYVLGGVNAKWYSVPVFAGYFTLALVGCLTTLGLIGEVVSRRMAGRVAPPNARLTACHHPASSTGVGAKNLIAPSTPPSGSGDEDLRPSEPR